MSVIQIAQDAVQGAVRRAESWLSARVLDLPGISDLRELCEVLAATERDFVATGDALQRLRRSGLAVARDYAAYNTARENMYTAHKRFRLLLGNVFASSPSTLRELPNAVYAPAITPSSPLPREGATGETGMSGLGAGPAAAAAIPAWMMGAIMLIILASIVLAITVVIGGIMAEEAIRDVLVTREQLRTTREAWTRRLTVYEDCRRAGRAPEECGAVARATVPMPPLVLRELPRPGEWLKWTAIGLGIVAVSGFAIWGIWKWHNTPSRGGIAGRRQISGAPKYRQLSASDFMDSDGGDYRMDDT